MFFFFAPFPEVVALNPTLFGPNVYDDYRSIWMVDDWKGGKAGEKGGEFDAGCRRIWVGHLSDPTIHIDGCRVPPQTARPRIFHHPDAKPAFIQESNGGCQLDTGWGSFSCGGEGVVFSYESAAAPLLTGWQEA